MDEYCRTIDTIQENMEKGMELGEAIDVTLDRMAESFILYDYIQANRAEVKGMLKRFIGRLNFCE